MPLLDPDLVRRINRREEPRINAGAEITTETPTVLDAPKFLPRLIDVTMTLDEASGGRIIQAMMMIPSGVLKPLSQ